MDLGNVAFCEPVPWTDLQYYSFSKRCNAENKKEKLYIEMEVKISKEVSKFKSCTKINYYSFFSTNNWLTVLEKLLRVRT